MTSGFGYRYRLTYPDGRTDEAALFGAPLKPGEVVPIGPNQWRVTEAVEVTDDDTVDYAVTVVPHASPS